MAVSLGKSNYQFTKFLFKRFNQNFARQRNFCDEKIGRPLNLLDEPVIGVEPTAFLNPFRPMKNMFQAVRFRYTYDNNFDPGQSFVDTTRKVFAMVTENLYNKDFENLSTVVDSKLLSKLTTAVNRLSDDERTKLLGIKENDIFIGSIYHCGFRKNIDNPSVNYFDMLFVFNSIRDIEKSSEELDKSLRKDKNSADSPVYEIKKVVQFMQSRRVASSFRLTKQVTPSVDEDWNVTYLNYVVVDATPQDS